MFSTKSGAKGSFLERIVDGCRLLEEMTQHNTSA
jgi:hypothetical protein